MRKLIVLILMIMVILPMSAVDGDAEKRMGQDELRIRGYKIAKHGEGVTLTITNAVTERLTDSDESGSTGTHETGPLEITGDGDRINLSPIVGSLLGSGKAGVFSEQVIFSYRVVGYEAADLTLTMTFSPLKNLNEELTDKNQITATYELGNLSYSFPDLSSDVSDGEENMPETVGDYISAKNGNTALPSVTVSNTDASFSTAFHVVDAHVDEYSVPRWIHRGAVAMTIDNTTYTDAAVGEYEAFVTITLTENG